MRKAIIGKTFSFDAAHRLPYYEGKCKEMHGHTWKVAIEVKGKVEEDLSSPTYGMVLDLNKLSSYMNEIKEELDHKVLNDVLSYPTCENIAYYIKMRFESASKLKVERITVQEGEGGYATLY